MAIQVASTSIDRLFSGQPVLSSQGTEIAGELHIPEYQRPYCWQEKQLQTLLGDFQNHHAEKLPIPYYLGSLILHQSGNKLNIIDGQQRITTLAIMGYLTGQFADLKLRYESPLSQRQISRNLQWLQQHQSEWMELLDFSRLQVTLVVTQSEDDAYNFFETQNTGGVRLQGPDIIKAHHLRAIERMYQVHYAKQWEALGELEPVVNSLLKGRYWNKLAFKSLPSHQQPSAVRDTIVDALAESTGIGPDVAFGRVKQVRQGLMGSYQEVTQQGYEVRQPLNAGVNSVAFLSYFQHLRQHYWEELDLPHQAGYVRFCRWLQKREGCGYLENLYEACMLMYLCQFGEQCLEAAAKKLFRVVYSRRVSNQKAVRENSIPAFIDKTPVLDWIAHSYTPAQLFDQLDNFKLKVDPSNLGEGNSVKKRFVQAVNEEFNLGLSSEEFTGCFAAALSQATAQLGDNEND